MDILFFNKVYKKLVYNFNLFNNSRSNNNFQHYLSLSLYHNKPFLLKIVPVVKILLFSKLLAQRSLKLLLNKRQIMLKQL